VAAPVWQGPVGRTGGLLGVQGRGWSAVGRPDF
jgi:hypothetical protein